jgi:hypothetical protein
MKGVVALLAGVAIMALLREAFLAFLPLALAAVPNGVADQFRSGPITSLVALSAILTITGVTTMFGAWVAARLAPDHATGHAVFAAVLWLTVLVFRGALDWHRVPFWVHVSTWILVPVAAWVGGRAWERAQARASRLRESFVSRNVAATR